MNSISISWDYDNSMNKDAFKVAVVVRFQRGMNVCPEYLSNMTSCDSPFEIFSSMLVVQSLSHIRCFATPGGAAPLSVGFPRLEYWRGSPFPSAGIFLTQELNLHLLHWQAIKKHIFSHPQNSHLPSMKLSDL